MTDDELIAALREEDAYNERFYEPDPLHKLSADRIEALVKELKAANERAAEFERRTTMADEELSSPSWQDEAMHQNALLHRALSRADRLEAALREIKDVAGIYRGGEFYVKIADRALEVEAIKSEDEK